MTRKHFIYGQFACAIVVWLGVMALAFDMPEAAAIWIYGCVGFIVLTTLAPNIIAIFLSYIAAINIVLTFISLRFFSSSFQVIPLNTWLIALILFGLIIIMTVRYVRFKNTPPAPVQNA